VQFDMLQKRLEEERVAGVSATELYRAFLSGYGGSTSPLSADAFAYGILAWFKENIAKLPEFVGGTMDFGMLLCATISARILGS